VNYIKTKNILDDLMYSMPENTPEIRRRMLSWLNASMQGVIAEPREWNFLRRSSTLTVTNGAITVPADFDRVTGIGSSDFSWYMDNSNQLSNEDAYRCDASRTSWPMGWTLDPTRTTITLHPATLTGTVTLLYQAGWPGDYPDSINDTIIPTEFTNLLQRAVLSNFYETDQNTDMAPISLQLDQLELKRMRALDNRRNPVIPGNRHGYLNNKVHARYW
jgi:hypothetical protein